MMPKPPSPNFVTITPDWRGETVVCLGSGPSLTREDVDFVRGRARVIAVNSTYHLAPWADVVYACDGKWWRWHHERVSATGARKVSIVVPGLPKPRDVQLLRNTGTTGLELDPGGLRTGKNSGYQAINLAVHLGAMRILLLGYDCQATGGRTHWHRAHSWHQESEYQKWVPLFRTLVEPLQRLGIEIINCSRETAIDAFPRRAITDVLTQDSVCELASAS